jgi:hypothetical protein
MTEITNPYSDRIPGFPIMLLRQMGKNWVVNLHYVMGKLFVICNL